MVDLKASSFHASVHLLNLSNILVYIHIVTKSGCSYGLYRLTGLVPMLPTIWAVSWPQSLWGQGYINKSICYCATMMKCSWLKDARKNTLFSIRLIFRIFTFSGEIINWPHIFYIFGKLMNLAFILTHFFKTFRQGTRAKQHIKSIWSCLCNWKKLTSILLTYEPQCYILLFDVILLNNCKL